MKKKSIIFTLLLALAVVGQIMIEPSHAANISEGYFINGEGDRALIEKYDGKIESIRFIKDANLNIDGRPVELKDFKTGMEVYIEHQGRRASYMDAYSAEKPGYIKPGSKMIKGRVSLIDRDQIRLQLTTNEEETFFLSPSSIITRMGENVSAGSLYLGDNVKIYLDGMDSKLISRMEIQGDSILVKGLYRGRLSSIDPITDTVYFEEIESFKNGNWERSKSGEKLSFNSDIPVYIGGVEIDKNNLKHYKGKTAYIALKDDFGKDRVEKMMVKNQYESSFSDKIENINWYSSQIELASKQNINIHPGTMVVKDGRLLDIKSLNPNTDGYIVADGKGGDLTASLIYIYNEDLNKSNIGQEHIYAGRLDRIYQNKLNLRDFFHLEDNSWESFGGDKELFYDQDTFIYDLDKKKKVSAKEFFASKYAIDEKNSRNPHERDWYSYIHTDGDRISAIYLQKHMDPLLGQRVTVGSVERIARDASMGDYVLLREARDWSRSHKEWMAKSASLYIYLEDTMIIKNGKRIDKTDLKPGDRLYITRDSNMAKVMVVR